jgi:hypothetical protein
LKIIEITIGADGSTKVETKGFSGSTCREASRLLELALGRVTAEALTSEYHQAEVAQPLDQRLST